MRSLDARTPGLIRVEGTKVSLLPYRCGREEVDRLTVKTLHRYILESLLVSVVGTLAVFTAVLLLGNIFKDVVELLANQSVSIWTIAHFFILLLPYVFSLSLPLALLAATLLVMGRLSADHELTAARASGISFFELIVPFLGTAAVLTVISFYINSFLAPATKYEFNQAFINIALKRPIALLEEGQYIKDFPDLVIFIGKRDIRKNELYNVRVTTLSNNEMTQEVYAEKGKINIDSKQLKLSIILYNAHINRRDPQDPTNIGKRRWDITVAEYPVDLDMTKMIDQRRAVKDDKHYTSWELWIQALELKREGILATPKFVEIHKRAALSMACLSFVLIGLPLGIQVQRRETSIGILISLVLAVIYYFLILCGEGFNRYPNVFPEFVVWIPNLIFQTIGLSLLWKQSRI